MTLKQKTILTALLLVVYLILIILASNMTLFEDGSFILGHVAGCLPFSLCTIGG
jgi:hypothetical protein